MEVQCNRWLRLVVAMGQSRSCKVANSDSCVRGIFSTSTKADNHARVEAARSYLDAWVGNGSNKGGKTNASSHKTTNSPVTSTTTLRHRTLSPMLVSGSSYLLPTLRLEKTDTPESIENRLNEETGIVNNSNTKYQYEKKWACPIVLDLRAWCPDGSPHYRPPTAGTLTQLTAILNRFGLTVVGLHGTPKELQTEAIEDLGLPSMFLSGTPSVNGNSARGSNNSRNYMQLQDIIQMVVQQQTQEEPIIIAGNGDIRMDGYKNNGDEATATTAESHSVEINNDSMVSVLKAATTLQNPEPEPQEQSTASILPPPIPPEATIYQGSVRSGQQVSSERGRSLVVLGSVNSGGEVLSDGDILVMGKLRGRAVAGLASPNAKIIASSMDPELVCISSVLATIENIQEHGIPSRNSPAMISLNREKDELVFQPIRLT